MGNVVLTGVLAAATVFMVIVLVVADEWGIRPGRALLFVALVVATILVASIAVDWVSPGDDTEAGCLTTWIGVVPTGSYCADSADDRR